MIKTYEVDITRVARNVSDSIVETLKEAGREPAVTRQELNDYIFGILDEQLSTQIIEKAVSLEFVDQMFPMKKEATE